MCECYRFSPLSICHHHHFQCHIFHFNDHHYTRAIPTSNYIILIIVHCHTSCSTDFCSRYLLGDMKWQHKLLINSLFIPKIKMAQSMHNSKPPSRGIRQPCVLPTGGPSLHLTKTQNLPFPKLLSYWKWGLLSNTAEPHTSSLYETF